jgi:hypothetical protein
MPLPRAQTRTPQTIEDISVELFDLLADDGSHERGARFSVQVGMSDGSLEVLTGDLVPHLTQQQISNLVTFMSNLRTQAEQEILP